MALKPVAVSQVRGLVALIHNWRRRHQLAFEAFLWEVVFQSVVSLVAPVGFQFFSADQSSNMLLHAPASSLPHGRSANGCRPTGEPHRCYLLESRVLYDNPGRRNSTIHWRLR